MNAVRVIKSNAAFFNAGTRADGAWRRRAISAFGNNVEPVMGSNSAEGHPADGGMPGTRGPAICPAVASGEEAGVAPIPFDFRRLPTPSWGCKRCSRQRAGNPGNRRSS